VPLSDLYEEHFRSVIVTTFIHILKPLLSPTSYLFKENGDIVIDGNIPTLFEKNIEGIADTHTISMKNAN
jgi:hypothetical protein